MPLAERASKRGRLRGEWPGDFPPRLLADRGNDWCVSPNRYPSAGGVAMILHKSYGPHTVTGAAALLMVLSMIINESLVARNFGTYTRPLFEISNPERWVPFLAIGLIVVAYLVNVAGNQLIGTVSKITAVLKIRLHCTVLHGGLVEYWIHVYASHREGGGEHLGRGIPRCRGARDSCVKGIHHHYQ